MFLCVTFFLFLFGFNLISCFDCPEKPEPTHFEAQLVKDLFCAYQSGYRPVKDHKTAVNVDVQFLIKYISFDSLEERIDVHSWMMLTWKDEFLHWDPSDYGGIKETIVDSYKIWTPQLSHYNSHYFDYQPELMYTTCLLTSNGTISCVPQVINYGICRTWLKYWPYDDQNCTFIFGSWMQTGEEVNFKFPKHNAIVLDEYKNGPGWKLKHVEHSRLSGKVSANKTHPVLRCKFVMKRQSAGLAAIIICPIIAIVTLTMISVTLDVKDDVRLALQCFALFGHFMFLTEIGYDIPTHTLDTPVVLLFIRDSMAICFSSIVLTLILSSIRWRSEAAPKWLATVNGVLTAGPSKYVVFTEFDPSDISDKNMKNDLTEEQSSSASEWLTLANVLNSIVSIVFVVAYIVLFIAYIPKDND